MNRQHKCPTQCEKDNCLNARREELLLRNAPRTGCDAAPAALSCCAKPTPCMADACDKTVCYKENFFVKPTSQCESPALTGYGKQYVSNTGKMITKCACVKFNGLQDTCRHPSCNNNPLCLEHPFPNCPPARKWRCDYMCKNDRSETKKNACE